MEPRAQLLGSAVTHGLEGAETLMGYNARRRRPSARSGRLAWAAWKPNRDRRHLWGLVDRSPEAEIGQSAQVTLLPRDGLLLGSIALELDP